MRDLYSHSATDDACSFVRLIIAHPTTLNFNYLHLNRLKVVNNGNGLLSTVYNADVCVLLLTCDYTGQFERGQEQLRVTAVTRGFSLISIYFPHITS